MTRYAKGTPTMSLDKLIPDFDGAEDIGAIHERLIPCARTIMLEHHLRFGNHRWSITALELYLWTGRTWCDPCTDRKPGQAKRGTWYVHPGRTPNYGRIDIAAGNGNGLFAGLLIRELDKRDGSAIALQTIIRGSFQKRDNRDTWKPDERAKIASIDGTSVLSGPLKLVPNAPIASDVWTGRRVFSTKNPQKKFYLHHPLRVAMWRTEKLKDSMSIWTGQTARPG